MVKPTSRSLARVLPETPSQEGSRPVLMAELLSPLEPWVLARPPSIVLLSLLLL
jgi:hypothetical protein